MVKKLLFVTALLATSATHAQWTLVHDDPDKVFSQVVFPDEMHGYATGHYISGGSFILRTIDGGLNWDTLNLPTSYISTLHMTSPVKGYIYRAGAPAIIVHTNNRFNSITGPAGIMDSCFAYFGIGHINDSTNFQLLNEGRLHKSLNYGTSFVPIWDSLTTFSILDFPTTSTGYIAGANKIMKTTNSGTTWNFVTTTLPFYAMAGKFTDANTGYLVSYDDTYDRSLRKTINGCVSFTTVSNFKVFTFAARNSYCIQADSAGNVSMTGNGGLTWMNELVPIANSGTEYFPLEITPGGRVWIASSYGQLMTRSGTLEVSNALAQNSIMHVYPNPASTQVTIETKTENGTSTCLLYNSLGECMANETFNGNTHTLSLAKIPAGIYYLTVNTGTSSSTTKLVKQ